jgi:hypothetical protein
MISTAGYPDNRWATGVKAMDKNNLIFYLVVGFGIFFLVPVAESVGENLGRIATILVIGYWGTMALSFFLFLLKNLFADYQVNTLLYNLWLFLSLISVAIGILAIVDDGIHGARWAICLIVYGGTVGYLKRKEL